MGRAKRWAVGVVALGVALGCAQEDVDAATPADSAADGPARERTVHVQIRLAVRDVSLAAGRVREAVAGHDGYVESGTERPSAHDGRATFEVRVPAASLGELRSELEGLGALEDASEEAIDVTAEHADLSARIRSAHAEEARLLELMSTRTDDLADVLAVERELARVSASIEQLEAGERDLGARVAMARVSVELRPIVAGFTEDPAGRIASAASGGISAARSLALAIAVAIAAMSPTLLLLASIALLARRLARGWVAKTSPPPSDRAR